MMGLAGRLRSIVLGGFENGCDTAKVTSNIESIARIRAKRFLNISISFDRLNLRQKGGTRRSFDVFTLAFGDLPHLPFPTKILQKAGKYAIGLVFCTSHWENDGAGWLT
jgi:hypothetical protein